MKKIALTILIAVFSSSLAFAGDSLPESSGNAATATALAANGANCAANSFPLGVDASGAAESCSTSISGNSATATALAANPADCLSNQFATNIAASGALTCAAIADADVPNNITITLAATATALAANGGNCSSGSYPLGVDASGAVESCGTTITGNAGTATALAADPGDCGSNTYATNIAASGALTCASITDASLSATVTNTDVAETIASNWVNTANPWADNEVADALTISGGTVNSSVIGGSTPAAGSFTTLTSTGILTLSTTAGITASVTQTQGQQPLTTTVNEVATVASNNNTVTLPIAAAGVIVVVINNGANTLQIFPASGDAIDGGSVNASKTLGTGANVIFVAHDATNWNRLNVTL